jgi:O-antigen/teichoic acid export membrane protein
MISGLAGIINETLDRAVFRHVIVDQKKALEQLGVYGANYKIGGFLLMFIQMYRYAVEPYFFNKSKDSDSKEQYSSLMNLFVGIIISMGLFILLYLDYIKYFIGSTYRDGLFVVPYIVLAYILSGVLFNLSVWFKLSDKTKFAFIIMAIGAIITVVINIIYIPKYSYGASAIAHVISYFIMVVISYSLSRKYFAIAYNLPRLFAYFGLGFCIYFVFKGIIFNYWFVDVVLKGIVLLLFVTFVAWKEKILKFKK